MRNQSANLDLLQKSVAQLSGRHVWFGIHADSTGDKGGTWTAGSEGLPFAMGLAETLCQRYGWGGVLHSPVILGTGGNAGDPQDILSRHLPWTENFGSATVWAPIREGASGADVDGECYVDAPVSPTTYPSSYPTLTETGERFLSGTPFKSDGSWKAGTVQISNTTGAISRGIRLCCIRTEAVYPGTVFNPVLRLFKYAPKSSDGRVAPLAHYTIGYQYGASGGKNYELLGYDGANTTTAAGSWSASPLATISAAGAATSLQFVSVAPPAAEGYGICVRASDTSWTDATHDRTFAVRTHGALWAKPGAVFAFGWSAGGQNITNLVNLDTTGYDSGTSCLEALGDICENVVNNPYFSPASKHCIGWVNLVTGHNEANDGSGGGHIPYEDFEDHMQELVDEVHSKSGGRIGVVWWTPWPGGLEDSADHTNQQDRRGLVNYMQKFARLNRSKNFVIADLNGLMRAENSAANTTRFGSAINNLYDGGRHLNLLQSATTGGTITVQQSSEGLRTLRPILRNLLFPAHR